MKKWGIRLLLGVGAILLVLAAWLLSSSIHSKSAVERYKDQLRAAGEKLSIDKLTPPHPDPDKNGASLFNEACRYMNSSAGALQTNTPAAMMAVAAGKAMIGSRQSEVFGPYYLGPITNSWDDIEQALGAQASAFALLKQASERPLMDFEPDYKQGFTLLLPHLSKLKEAALLLSPAAMDALHRGDAFEAMTNLHTLLMLVSKWKEPLLISHMVRVAMAQIAVPVQWEFLQATNLADQQLEVLQRDWTNMEFIQSMETTLVMERAWASVTIRQLRTSNNPTAMFSDTYGTRSSSGISGDWLDGIKDIGRSAKTKTAETIWRVSWSYSDELMALQGDQVMVEAIRQVQTNGYFKDVIDQESRRLMALGMGRPNSNWLRNELDDELFMLGIDSVEGLSRTLDRLLAMEAAREMTVTSIALKRYQLRHGMLPSGLNALIPELLPEVPRDPADGRPLRYRLNADGTCLLYSIGKDGRDDGGDPTPDGKVKGWLHGRDWVWPQPATAEEIQKFYDNPPK